VDVQKQQLAIQVRLNANSNEFSDGAVSSTENHEIFVRRKNNQPTGYAMLKPAVIS
jgi:hypothetical protein